MGKLCQSLEGRGFELKDVVGRLPTTNRLTVALRIAATTLRPSRTYLGAQFRRLKARLGAPIAIKAMAAKLARLVYRMLRYGMQFVDQGAEFYEARQPPARDQLAQAEGYQPRIPDH